MAWGDKTGSTWYDPSAQLEAPSDARKGRPVYGSSTGDAWDEARFQSALQPFRQGMQTSEGQYGQALASQRAALGMYGSAAAGRGPSVAVGMMNQGNQAAAAAAFEAGLRGGGGNLAGMSSQAQAGLANAAQASSTQAGLLRAQEIEAARAGYAGVAGQMAGQAGQMTQFYGGSMQAGQLAQMQSDLQYDMFQREMALKEKMAKHQRRKDWLDFGGKVVGSVVGGVAGGGA